MIKISIVIPVFNMISTIPQTINSILDQKYKNLELIIIAPNLVMQGMITHFKH